MTQMHLDDAVWLYMESGGESMQVTLMSVYEPGPHGPLSREELERHVAERVVARVPRFRQRLKEVPLHADFPYWVDDPSFCVARHVRTRTVAAPGDWRAVLATASDVQAEPLDRRRPLWDVTLLTGIDHADGLPAGSFAVACRFHHAMVDGKSVMEVVSLLHDATAEADTAAPSRVPVPRPVPGPTTAAITYRAAAHAVTRPLDMLVGIIGSLPAIGSELLARRALPTLSGRSAPRTRFNCAPGPRRRIGLVGFELDRVRAVRSLAAGSTLNDVALAIVAGALRAYLDDLGELPREPLVTACPISVRRDQPGAPALGNQVSAMLVSLCTDIADPVERLTAIAAATREAKVTRDAVGAKVLTDLNRNLTAAATVASARLALLAANRISLINTITSNVPGSQRPIYFAGRRLRANIPVVALGAGVGLIHIVTSYDGTFQINFVVDAEAMPDHERYEEFLRAALHDLEVCVAEVPPRAPDPDVASR